MASKIKTIFALWPVLFLGITGLSVSITGNGKPKIPPDLYYRFKAVSTEENAIVNWRRAAEIEVPLNGKERQIIKYCWTPTEREPSFEDLNNLQAWFRRNKNALELFDASLQKPKAQWPERDPQNVQPELKSLSLLIQARLFEADQLAERNKFSVAAKSLGESLKLAQTGIEGDAALIHYLVACRARAKTQDAILRLACHKEVPISILEELLKRLPSLNTETNAYDHILRVEFMREYNESLDSKKLAESWSKISGTNAALLLSFYPDDLQRAFRVLLDPSLVALHPKPFDANAEIEKSIRIYRIYRTNSLVPWTERSGEVELENEEAHSDLVADVALLMELVKDEPLPLTRQAAQKARNAYLEIENPIGRILDSSIIGFAASDLKVCEVRTDREATRAFLALLIFEKRKGQLPTTLSGLVEEKILNSVPTDIFCGKPLRYSKAKRKIWSVGADGVDDGGESGKSKFEKDVVWQIPEIN